MEIDLTPYDKDLIISILAGAIDPRDINDDEADMLDRFCDLMKHCDDVGTTFHIN